MTQPNGTFVVRQYENQEETKLDYQLVCRILRVENVSESKEKTLEEWKFLHNPNTALFERMEHVSRPIIYDIDLDAPEHDLKPRASKATHKLLLGDSSENYFYGIEMEELGFLHPAKPLTNNPLPIPLGGQLVVKRGTTVLYGMLLLRNADVMYTPPDLDSNLALLLNSGIVKKYIDVLESALRDLKPRS